MRKRFIFILPLGKYLYICFPLSQVIELLLSHGANVNAYDKRERRALHYAAFMGHSSIISQLISAGGDHIARDKLVRLAPFFGQTVCIDIYSMSEINLEWHQSSVFEESI